MIAFPAKDGEIPRRIRLMVGPDAGKVIVYLVRNEEIENHHFPFIYKGRVYIATVLANGFCQANYIHESRQASHEA